MTRSRLSTALIASVFTLLFLVQCSTTGAQTFQPSTNQEVEEVTGRWDITVYDPVDGVYPSWFSISESNGELTGWFVGKVGNARPISYLHYDGEQLWLSLPPQYEQMSRDLLFVGRVDGDQIEGVTQSESGKQIRFSGNRAPELPRDEDIEWGDPIELIGDNLSNWRLRYDEAKNGWSIQNGHLMNTPPSNDLITRQTFRDFKLHAEFKIPEGSNSGVYLRGRYEVQIEDTYDMEPDSLRAGAVYGFLTPTSMAINPPGEWNTYDITLNGRWLTLTINGETVIDNEEIPGITGGALNSREGEPGPIMLQGDHGPVEFRNVTIAPAE